MACGFARLIQGFSYKPHGCARDRVRSSRRCLPGIPCGFPGRRHLPTLSFRNPVLTGIPCEHCGLEKALPERGSARPDFPTPLAVRRQRITAIGCRTSGFFVWRHSYASAVFIIPKPSRALRPDDLPIAESALATHGQTGKSCTKLHSPFSPSRCCCSPPWRRRRPREPSR